MALRSALRTRARDKADQDNSTFPTDSQYNSWLDEAAGAVWRRMVGAGWKPDRTTLSIAATGATSYTVGTDVHTVIEVNRIEGTSKFPLRRIKPEESQAMAPLTGQAELYEFVGGASTAMTIEFFPRPTSGSYEVRYTKRFPGFTGDSDTWYGPDGTDQCIVLLAAIEGASKEDAHEKVASLQDKLKFAWSEVIEQANWMDQKSVPTVRDTRSQYPRDGADWLAKDAWDY